MVNQICSVSSGHGNDQYNSSQRNSTPQLGASQTTVNFLVSSKLNRHAWARVKSKGVHCPE